jgi:succinylarginine dihydrolase
MEHEERTDQLRVLTQGMNPCEVVDALPSSQPLRDEGAANHMRLCGSGNNRNRAVHVFVHEPASESDSLSPLRYVSRQSVVASHHVSRKLTLAEEKCVFIEQSQRAINAGVFHNDVIATSHGNLLLCHELAFTNTPQSIERMSEKYRQVVGEELICEIVTESMLPIEESVRSYLFNSQILSKSDGSFHLLCPSECGESERVRTVIEGWLASESNPISSVETIGVQESMSNGGGPACLRLRLDVDEEQVSQLEPRWRFTPERHSEIARWIDNYYPARLCIDDLARWDFAEHAMAAVYAFA